MGLREPYFSILKNLDIFKKLPIYIKGFLRDDQFLDKPFYGMKYRVDGIKYFLDGSLGARTAAMSYKVEDNNPLLNYNDEELYIKIKTKVLQGFDITCHAIGDLANEQIAKIYQRLYDENIVKTETLSIEHCMFLNEKTIQILDNYPIKISVQPLHYFYDLQEDISQIIDVDLNYSFLWKTLIKNQLLLGTDFPVVEVDIIKNLQIAIDRISKFDVNHQEKLNIYQAIESYTDTKLRVYDWGNFTYVDKPIDKNFDTKILGTVIDGIPYINKYF